MHGFANRTGAVLLVAMVAITFSAATISAQLNDSVDIAQRVLRATYPELEGNIGVGLDSNTDSDWRTASLVSVVVRVHDKTASNHTRAVLVAHVRIAGGRFSSVLFSGSYVEQHDYRAIVEYARRQNDTAERVIEELKKAGLRFMTDERAFLEAAGLQRLEPLLGKIQRAEPRFVAVPPIPTSVDHEHQPVWVVELRTTASQNVTDCYDLIVEPVDLRLIRISKESCSK